MKRFVPILKVLVLVAAIVVVFVAADALAIGGGGPLGGCPRKGIQCPQNYDPVTCSNGVTYPNACEAFVACATGCTGGGGGA